MVRLRRDWRLSVTTVKDILDFFEDVAPAATAMDFDNVGLLVGDGGAAVTKALLTLDITAEAAEEAAALGCELIISHHPVIFRPLRALRTRDAAYVLARHGMAAVCMHTNLDLSERFGVNTCLAAALGVENLRRADSGDCLFVGTLAEETDMLAFARHAKEALGCEGLRYTDVRERVYTVALSSGAGGSEIFAAAQEGADVLVTGEIKHHEINAANELGVNIVDAGHFKSEDVVLAPLRKKLEAAFPEVRFVKSRTYSDKIKYI